MNSMSIMNIFSMFPSRVVEVFKTYRLKREIHWAQMNLELTNVEIDEKLLAKRELTKYLLALRAELRDRSMYE